MITLLVMAGVFCAALFCRHFFEVKFGKGTFKDFGIGLFFCLLSVGMGSYGLLSDSSRGILASHRSGKMTIVTRNALHQITSVKNFLLSDISEIEVAVTKHRSAKGRIRYSEDLELTVDGNKVRVPSDGQAVRDQYKTLYAFLTDSNAENYRVERDDVGSIFLWSIGFLVPGLWFLKMALFDQGEFGKTKRAWLQLVNETPYSREDEKFGILAQAFRFSAASFCDELLDKMPICKARAAAKSFGGGLIGFGNLKKREILLAVWEVQIYLYFLLDGVLDGLDRYERGELDLQLFEKRIVLGLELPDTDLVSLAAERLESYRGSLSGASNKSASYLLMNNLNYIFLNKKLNRDFAFVSSQWLGSGNEPLIAESSDSFAFFKKCFVDLFQHNNPEDRTNDFEVRFVLKKSISELKRGVVNTNALPPTKSSSDRPDEAEIASNAKSSVGRMLEKTGRR